MKLYKSENLIECEMALNGIKAAMKIFYVSLVSVVLIDKIV